MKVNAFKQLIKEAVAEAVREELLAIMSSESSKPKPSSLQEMKTVSFKSDDIHEVLDVRTQLRSKMESAFGFNRPVSTYDAPINNTNQRALSEVSNALAPVIDPTGDNPYLNFIMDAASNMTAQDKAGLRNLE